MAARRDGAGARRALRVQRYALPMRLPPWFGILLIGLGVLALLARTSQNPGWVWLALVAGLLLYGYAQQRTYGFLVIGGVLAGAAVGLLLQGLFPRCDGVFLISLGAGLIAVHRVEPRQPRYAWGIGVGLALVGLVNGLMSSQLLSSAWFAMLLIAVGAALVWRRHRHASFPPPLREGAGPPAGGAAPGTPPRGTPAAGAPPRTDATDEPEAGPSAAEAPEDDPERPPEPG